ncbi:MAG TPA: tetratricopeptide repeat protein, partial [Pirellulales bacterium]
MRAQDAGRSTRAPAASLGKRLGGTAGVLLAVLAAAMQPAWGAGGLAAIDAFNIGRYHDASGEYAKAISAYNEAIQGNPKLGVAYLARAKAYSKLGQHELAIADCTRALKQHSRFADALVTRADAYGALGKYREALADLRLAIKLEPRNAVMLQHRGRIYQLQGHAQLAAADFKTALSIDPLLSTLPPLVAGDVKAAVANAAGDRPGMNPNRVSKGPAPTIVPRQESSPAADASRAQMARASDVMPATRAEAANQRRAANGRILGQPLA